MIAPATPAAAALEQANPRTRAGGPNLMEILLFTLGTQETFGVNVFKVREIGKTPAITKAPNMPPSVEGLISLRGNVIPVLSLARAMQLEVADDGGKDEAIMVVEFNLRTLAFVIRAVQRIVRVEWSKVRDPELAAAGARAYITAITELSDGKLVSILDLEEVLSSVFTDTTAEQIENIDKIAQGEEINIFFADDSQVARRNTIDVLDRLGVKHKHAHNGAEAWRRLSALAGHCEAAGKSLRAELDLVLLDAEMPEMDGYVLARHIKSDRRFDGIPVVMHSSLSSDANRLMAKSVGVDAYVAKFDPEALAATLRSLLKKS